MAIKHNTIKAPGEKLYAVADWNATHTIDAGTITALMTSFADQDVKQASSPTFAGLTLTNALPIASGGTNQTAFTNTQIVYFDGTRLTGNAGLTWSLAGGMSVRRDNDGSVASFRNFNGVNNPYVLIEATNTTIGLTCDATTTYPQFFIKNGGANRLTIESTGVIAMPHYTTDGFVKFSASAGTLAVDTNVYLTSVTAHNVLSATHGDTLADSVHRGDLFTGNSTPKWSRLAIGTSGKFLKSDGNDPSWQSIVVGDVGSGAAMTRVSDTNVTLTLGGTPATSLLASVSLTLGWSGQLSIARGGTNQSAFTTDYVTYFDGTRLTGCADLKWNATTGLIINESGTATIDVRIEGDTNANLFFLDASADMVGFGHNAPADMVSINGNMRLFSATDVYLKIASTASATDGWLIHGYHPATDNQLQFSAYVGGVDTPMFVCKPDGQVCFGSGCSIANAQISIISNWTTDNSAGFIVSHSAAVVGTSYGADVAVTGASTLNVGLRVNSAGGTTNYGIIVRGSWLGTTSYPFNGFGTTTPVCYMHIVGEQKAGNYGDAATAIKIEMTNDNSSVYGGIVWKDTDSRLGETYAIYAMRSSPANYLDFTYNQTLMMRFLSTQGVIFNEGGAADYDFRVESDSYNFMFMIDSGANQIQFGTGTQGAIATFDNTGIIFNEDSQDRDFRVESNGNSAMLFVDGGADCVTIGYAGNLGGTLNVYNSTSNTTQFTGRHLNIRGGDGTANSVSEIFFGIGGYTNAVCVVGSKVIDGTGNTKSNFYVGLRNVTTDTAVTTAFAVECTGSVIAGYQAALATNATDGFLYIPTCAGTPTGAPTAVTGHAAVIMDGTNHILYVYDSAWRACM